jgi:hypothetical protein
MRPLDSDSFIIGIFQIIFGIWIMMPSHSIGFIEQSDNIAFVKQYGEFFIGVVVLCMGVSDIVFVYLQKYTKLKNMELVGAAYWAAITAGWISTVPYSTAVIVYGFFTAYSVFQYLTWGHYLRNNLHYKKVIGSI